MSVKGMEEVNFWWMAVIVTSVSASRRVNCTKSKATARQIWVSDYSSDKTHEAPGPRHWSITRTLALARDWRLVETLAGAIVTACIPTAQYEYTHPSVDSARICSSIHHRNKSASTHDNEISQKGTFAHSLFYPGISRLPLDFPSLPTSCPPGLHQDPDLELASLSSSSFCSVSPPCNSTSGRSRFTNTSLV